MLLKKLETGQQDLPLLENKRDKISRLVKGMVIPAGEALNALGHYRDIDVSKTEGEHLDLIRKKAIQTGAMAIRLLEEIGGRLKAKGERLKGKNER
ncbi:MAG: hypothetical protein JRD05_00625 [Deltaproteobacteria bacterium]|nr:hypothetical protein [Deltaproteobacteria bacterium]